MSPIEALASTLAPFINQTERSPVVSRHKMSALPSPLKSLAAATFHIEGTFPRLTDDITCAPFMNHMAVLPLVSRQSKSNFPSPSKSCWATIDHLAGTLARPADDRTS